MDKIKVIILEKNEVLQEGLSLLLNRTDDIEVITKCSTIKECIHTIAQYTSDVIILDPEDDIISFDLDDGILEIFRLQQFIQQRGTTRWAPMMAASTLVTLPVVILFLFTQRTFIEGIALTGIKG